MQRRRMKATRNAGLVATVSARALMKRAPSRVDFAQLGMSPQRGRSTVRPSSRWSTTVSGSVGATFQEGWKASGSPSVLVLVRTSASKIRATSSGGVCWVMRPHMREWWHESGARDTSGPPSRVVWGTLTDVQPVPASPRRPFGVIVVALLQLGTVVVALGSYLAGIDLPWEGSLSDLLAEHGWARIAIGLIAVLVLVAAVGMWRLRRWGWALMISLVGLSLATDLTIWFSNTGQDRYLALYLRMGFDIVSAFYLNTSAVQAAFDRRPHDVRATPTRPPAGRLDQ